MATFSVTDRLTWRRCRRKWDYSSIARQNLTGIGAGPEALELGSLVHRALADWIMDQTKFELQVIFLHHASQRQQEILSVFEEKYHLKPNSEILDSLHNIVMLGAAMMQNYQEFHGSPLPSHMRFAVPEQEVLIRVPGTEHKCDCAKQIEYADYTLVQEGCKECNGTGIAYHHLSATLDGLLQDERDRLLVLEHKTYENRPKIADLQMNDQFTGYAWVVRELNIGQVFGVAYDGIWKRAQPPKYMQKERRSGVLNDLFIRKVLPKSDAELDEWGRNLTLEINEMANDPEIYPNIPWQGCMSDCGFVEVCRMQQLGEDPSGLIKMKYVQREVIVRGGQTISTG